MISYAQSAPLAKERRQGSIVQHHLREEKRKSGWDYQRKICQIIALISAGVSANYATMLWLFLDSFWGALFDYCFCALHLGAFYWIRRQQYSRSAYWTLVMVALQVAGGVALFVGPETGFQYYLFCLPAITYMVLRYEPTLRKGLIVLLGFAMLLISEQVAVPSLRVSMSETLIDFMYYGNLILVLLINFFSIKFYADEAHHAYQQQKQLLETDSLTGLANRRSLFEQAKELYRTCDDYRLPISAILLDIDHLSRINERFGHQAGDAALKRCALNIRHNLRDTDLAARFDGEEFLIILPETDLLAAEQIAERITQSLLHSDLMHSQEAIQLKASVGISCSHHMSNGSMENLIHEAESALKDAKRHGRNRIKLAYTSSDADKQWDDWAI